MGDKDNFEKNNPLTSGLLKKLAKLHNYATSIYCILFSVSVGRIILLTFKQAIYIGHFGKMLLLFLQAYLLSLCLACLIPKIESSISQIKKRKTKGVIQINCATISLFDDDDLLDELIKRGVLTKIDTTDGSTVYEYED